MRVPLVSPGDVRQARALLEGLVRTTPLEGSRPRSDRVGGPVSLTCGNLQRTGSSELVLEPAGGAAVAAVLEDPTSFAPPVVAVVSGGNIDALRLGEVVRHGLVAAGRFLSLRVAVPDRPGSLAGLLAVVARTGSGVLDVEHSRTGAGLHVDEVEVAVQLETRGPEQSGRVRDLLGAEGCAVRV